MTVMKTEQNCVMPTGHVWSDPNKNGIRVCLWCPAACKAPKWRSPKRKGK